MLKKSVNIWILFLFSLFLVTLLISFALENTQAAFFLLIMYLAVPFTLVILKNLSAAWKNADRSHKLKTQF